MKDKRRKIYHYNPQSFFLSDLYFYFYSYSYSYSYFEEEFWTIPCVSG